MVHQIAGFVLVKPLPLGIGGMQQVVRFMRIGLSQKFVVQLFNLRVVVGLAQYLALILGLKGAGSLGNISVQNICVLVGQEAFPHIGLAAAVYTAAGATHNLNKVVLAFAGTDLVH